MMEAYVHRVHYYETDKMGCVHHSNHVRWMEEARVAYLERIGVPFTLLEARGVYSPVVGVECRYRRPAHFDEEIRVEVRIRSFDRLRLKIGYEMIRVSDGELIAAGSSEHCFTDLDGRPIALSKTHSDLDALLRARIEPQTEPGKKHSENPAKGD